MGDRGMLGRGARQLTGILRAAQSSCGRVRAGGGHMILHTYATVANFGTLRMGGGGTLIMDAGDGRAGQVGGCVRVRQSARARGCPVKKWRSIRRLAHLAPARESPTPPARARSVRGRNARVGASVGGLRRRSWGIGEKQHGER